VEDKIISELAKEKTVRDSLRVVIKKGSKYIDEGDKRLSDFISFPGSWKYE